MSSVRAKRREARLGVGRAVAHGGGVLDHLVVLTLDQRPVDRVGQDGQEIGQRRAHARLGQVEPLARDGLQTRRQLEAEQAAEGEGHLALAMAVDVLAPDLDVGAVARGTPSIIAAASEDEQRLSWE